MTDRLRCVFPVLLLLLVLQSPAQCPASVHLQGNNPGCLGSILTVDAIAGVNYTQIDWYNGTSLVHTAHASAVSVNGTTVAGGNGSGTAANQLEAWGVYVDGQGNVYAADIDNGRVEKWAPGATSCTIVAGRSEEHTSELQSLV